MTTFQQIKQKHADDWKREASYFAASLETALEPEDLMEAARRVQSLVHAVLDLACDACDGSGQRAYPSTATWKGGIGGCAITTDVCDKCWGTGRKDKAGPNLRIPLDHERKGHMAETLVQDLVAALDREMVIQGIMAKSVSFSNEDSQAISKTIDSAEPRGTTELARRVARLQAILGVEKVDHLFIDLLYRCGTSKAQTVLNALSHPMILSKER